MLETSDLGAGLDRRVVEEPAGKITFSAQLRPRNYFPTEEGMWQPGRRPLVMATDAWDVEGGVDVRFKTRVTGRPYTIQEQVVELAETRYEGPVEAVEAFASSPRSSPSWPSRASRPSRRGSRPRSRAASRLRPMAEDWRVTGTSRRARRGGSVRRSASTNSRRRPVPRSAAASRSAPTARTSISTRARGPPPSRPQRVVASLLERPGRPRVLPRPLASARAGVGAG